MATKEAHMRRVVSALAAMVAVVGVSLPAAALGRPLNTNKAANAASKALPRAYGWSGTSEDHFLVDSCVNLGARKVRCQYHMYGRDSDFGQPYVFHCHGSVKVSAKRKPKKLRIAATEPSDCEQSFSYDPNTGSPSEGPLPH